MSARRAARDAPAAALGGVPFHCTERLLKAMRMAPADASLLRDRSRLGPWTATLIRVSRLQLVVVMSEPTRLAVVLDAAPYRDVPRRFVLALAAALDALEVPEPLIVNELSCLRVLVPVKAHRARCWPRSIAPFWTSRTRSISADAPVRMR